MHEALATARAKMWEYQKRMNCFPDVNVGVNKTCWFNMAKNEISFDVPEKLPQPYLHCYMEDYDLQRIIHRDLHWNNAEVGFRVMFDRVPNVYSPDTHTLLSFFHI